MALHRTRHRLAICLAAVAGALAGPVIVPGSATAGPEPATRVFLNGQPSEVYFNDGDSFRVLKGKKKGAKARLAGFNTLESHGAVHQWGDWTAKELYHLAKMATLHARRGVWKCTTEGDTDTYGRTLTFCPDLAEELIRLGFAHALSVDDKASDERLLAAQQEAIDNARGIWAHGVPPFVVTSLHSAEEDVEGRGTYNRVVSTEDGHSIRWIHDSNYEECQRVCVQVYPPDDSVIDEVLTKLKANHKQLISGVSDKDLTDMLSTYQRYRLIDRQIAKDKRPALAVALRKLAEEGAFGSADAAEVSCMVHVPFTRRYGTGRAECLK